jgi:hypothetical protein
VVFLSSPRRCLVSTLNDVTTAYFIIHQLSTYVIESTAVKPRINHSLHNKSFTYVPPLSSFLSFSFTFVSKRHEDRPKDGRRRDENRT